MQPLLRDAPDDETLARRLYAIQLLCIVGSFLLTVGALQPTAPPIVRDAWTLFIVWLAIVWANFSPFYTILALKSVETWELFLVSAGLFAYLRGWRWSAAAAIAAAGLIKVLPLAFLLYWLVTDRRTFLRACAALAALLLLGHMLYGPEMGAAYLSRIAAGAAGGSSYGLDWHENVSLKAAIAKVLGHLTQPNFDGAQASGYFLALTGWRRRVATVLGDGAVIAGVAALIWTWTRARAPRSHEQILWEWSGLAVAVLILSPNTIFEYSTLALGAISYVFMCVCGASGPRALVTRATLLASLTLLGGVLPRQWLNRLTMIDALNRWTGYTHLMPSEGYQYYCFPLAGLLLLMAAIWRLRPETGWVPVSGT